MLPWDENTSSKLVYRWFNFAKTNKLANYWIICHYTYNITSIIPALRSEFSDIENTAYPERLRILSGNSFEILYI